MVDFGLPRSESTSAARERIEAAGRAFAKAERQTSHQRRVRLALENRHHLLAAKVAEKEAEVAAKAARAARYLFDGPERLTMAKIAAEVAEKHGLVVADLTGSSRVKSLAVARAEGYWRCRNETRKSLGDIGRFFKRDHTTVLAGCRKHEERMVQEVPFDG